MKRRAGRTVASPLDLVARPPETGRSRPAASGSLAAARRESWITGLEPAAPGSNQTVNEQSSLPRSRRSEDGD